MIESSTGSLDWASWREQRANIARPGVRFSDVSVGTLDEWLRTQVIPVALKHRGMQGETLETECAAVHRSFKGLVPSFHVHLFSGRGGDHTTTARSSGDQLRRTVMIVGSVGAFMIAGALITFAAIGDRAHGLFGGGLLGAFFVSLVLDKLWLGSGTASNKNQTPSSDPQVLFELACDHVADVVFAFCVGHVKLIQAKRANGDNLLASSPKVLSADFFEAMNDLKDALSVTAHGDRDDLQMMGQIAFERLEDCGYTFRVIPTGTTFAESMRGSFRVIGNIRPGSPVQTRRAAVFFGKALVHPGELRLVRDAGQRPLAGEHLS